MTQTSDPISTLHDIYSRVEERFDIFQVILPKSFFSKPMKINKRVTLKGFNIQLYAMINVYIIISYCFAIQLLLV